MDDAKRELELRVEGVAGEADLERVRAAVVELDPGATARFDPATGIVHVATVREALYVTAALDSAGLVASAMTG